MWRLEVEHGVHQGIIIIWIRWNIGEYGSEDTTFLNAEMFAGGGSSVDMREENGISHVDWVRQNKWEGFGVGFWGRAASGGDVGAGHGQNQIRTSAVGICFSMRNIWRYQQLFVELGGLIALGPVTLEL